MTRKKTLILIFILLFIVLGLSFIGRRGIARRFPLTITEICACNKNAAYDDNGDYGADYIEIYNSSDGPVSLLGWGLTDSRKDLFKYTFGDVTVEPGQAVIAWSSPCIDDTSLYRDDYVPSDIHDIPFKISKGEVCILTSPDEKYVQRLPIPYDLPDNKCYASCLDDPGRYNITSATPYYVEETFIPEKKEILEAPSFSIKGGWYDGDVVVTLDAPKGDIYYSLNGSVPDSESYKYEGPITISNRTQEPNIWSAMGDIATANTYIPDFPVDKGTVLKAVAITDNGTSEIVSQTYFVGLDSYGYDGISIMSVSMDPDDLFGYEKGIYVQGKVKDIYGEKMDLDPFEYIYDYCNYGKEGRGWERPVNIEFFSEDHHKVFEQKAGIRIHGGFSIGQNQKSFNLYSRAEYDGNEYFKYDFFKGNGNGYSKVVLRTGGSNDLFVTKQRDVFCQSLVADRDVGIQRAIPCALFLNGEYWGMYFIQEGIGESYIHEHYGIDEDNVIIIKNNEVSTDDPEDLKLYTDLVDYISTNDMAVDSNYRYVEDKIDIQSLIDYYITEIYVANGDAFSNNLALWRAKNPTGDKYGDGKWRWLLYDLDESCAMITELTNASIDSFIEGHWEISPLNGDKLFSSIIKNEEFKERFVSSFIEMTEKNFQYESVHEKLSILSAKCKDADIKSQERFRGDFVVSSYEPGEDFTPPYSEDDYNADIAVIDDFFKERASYITNYMKNDLGLSD
ncbi:CotH kinase family protein [Butyrivibrio sp. INlla21]|uniref:CotH kinase family protein n=1 Tax=Butyrivibrio sp. INlla21 TaxID=1520811 RepID=UPI0008E58C49|nr:CotH kinase family protein [Butyrivibrio sp. INlla21]SFU54043.1 Lamin Tail Domain [Butyrivibrio sp. INlla21]